MESARQPPSRNEARHFDRAKAVLSGEDFETTELGVRKMLGFVLAPAGTNTWIKRECIELRFVRENRRTRHQYFLDLAPGIVWDLMGQLGVTSITEATVGLLSAKTRCAKPLRPTDDASLVAWIIPGPDEIVIMTRPLGDAEAPETGPWVLPDPLPPWKPPDAVHESFDPPLSCPNCGRESDNYRRLSCGSYVCSTCGRSFPRP